MAWGCGGVVVVVLPSPHPTPPSGSLVPGAVVGRLELGQATALGSLGAALLASTLLLEEESSLKFGFSVIFSFCGADGEEGVSIVKFGAQQVWREFSFRRTFTEVFLGSLPRNIALLPCPAPNPVFLL